MSERLTTSHSHIPIFHQQPGEELRVLSGWNVKVIQPNGEPGVINDVISWEVKGGFLLCDMKDGATAIFPSSMPYQYIMIAEWEPAGTGPTGLLNNPDMFDKTEKPHYQGFEFEHEHPYADPERAADENE